MKNLEHLVVCPPNYPQVDAACQQCRYDAAAGEYVAKLDTTELRCTPTEFRVLLSKRFGLVKHRGENAIVMWRLRYQMRQRRRTPDAIIVFQAPVTIDI